MASQQQPKLWRIAVDTVADLSTLFDARMSDGDDCWVVLAGVTHGKWVLDKNSVLAANGTTIVATLSTIGRWIYFGAGAAGGSTAWLTTASEATLSNIDLTTLVDGQLIYVKGRRRYYRWDALSSATSGIAGEIVMPASSPGTGRFISVPWTTSIENALQAAWQIDPIGGSDDNATGPLATFMEFTRRVPVMYIPMTVQILSTLPDTDNLVYEPMIEWRQALSASYPTLVITGTRTVGGNSAVATSSDETGNQAPRVDAGVALTIGSIIIATSGAQVNATAVVTALIAGTNFETSPWRSAGGSRVAPPAVADTIASITLPTINRTAIGGTELQNGPSYVNFNIKTGTLQVRAFYTTCTFPSGSQAVPAAASGSYIYFGCGFLTSTLGTGNGGTRTSFLQCGMIRASAGALGWSNGAVGNLTDCVLRNWSLASNINGQQVSQGGFLCVASVGLAGYGNAQTGCNIRTNGQLVIQGTLYGADPGGASIGTDVRQGGKVFVLSTVTPSLTGATELLFENAGTANAPPPLATGVIPVAVALTTWNQWAGAPFNRDVLSYKTGSGINNMT